MEILGKLFGSENKVKMMRLFLFNPDNVFSVKEIAKRIKSISYKVRKEITVLQKAGLVKRRALPRSKRGGQGYALNHQFQYLSSLQNFLVNTEPLHSNEIIKKIGRLGSIKLIIIAGIFIQESESRADILIVGDGVKPASLDKTIKSIESEVGKELRYAYFTTKDFKYRLSMYDKLTRDILDYPHRKVLNKLGID